MSDHNLQQSGGIFQAGHGSNVQIHGGQFVQHNHAQNVHNCCEADDGFKHLQAHVATSAFDSQEHVDAPKCHPNTRKAVLDEIMNWIILTVTRIQWVLWLNGAAGAGKSAIGRSIVDLCIERNIPIARFFFFRTDSSRNNIKPLVATLVHQLLQNIPDLKPIIIPRIESDSLIFTKSLKTQFEFLIFAPLRELKRSPTYLHTLVFLFDGVDECDDKDDQAALIRIISEFVRSNSFPAIAFFASRTEDQISTVFRSAALSNITHNLPLDDTYLPDDDIRVFLKDSVDEIKRTHSFACLLDGNWPTASVVEEIVEKSSGQFIYASVVIKFCAMLGHHPEQQLNIVRGLRPRGALTPFAQLDALYQQIFSQVHNIKVASLLLAWIIYSPIASSLKKSADFLELEMGDIYAALAPLQSVIDYKSDNNIQFLHKSLSDFLLDKERSQEYYIDQSSWLARLSVKAHKIRMGKGTQGYLPLDMYLRSNIEATPELRIYILAYNPENIQNFYTPSSDDYLDGLQKLDFGDGPGGAVYQHQLNTFVRYLSKRSPTDLNDVGRGHNISDILRQIESESAQMEPDTTNYKIQGQLETADISDGENEESLAAKEGRQEMSAAKEGQQETSAANEEQQEFQRQSSSARSLLRATWNSEDRETGAQEAGIQREKGRTTFMPVAISDLPRRAKK